MTRLKLPIAFAILMGLIALMLFTQYRWSQMVACERRGGMWDGPASRCRLVPAGILLERELKRTDRHTGLVERDHL
ncbi:MAG: hypothetical protein AAFQ44_09590 [Pseudomonadota bacterium]